MVSRLLVVSGLLVSTFIAGCGDAANDSVVAVANAKDPSAVAVASSALEAQPRACDLRLEFTETSNTTTRFPAKVRLKNLGKSDLTLVMPGDGSSFQWRTPIVGWSFLPADSKEEHPRQPPRRRDLRCGNINPLKPDDVFTLKPGETKELTQWIAYPYRLLPGKYRVVFYHSNVPELEWSGVPLGKHDADAMRRIRHSTPIALVSNEVLLEIAE